MDLRECIYHHLKELVAIPSISNTKEESLAADYLAKSLAEQDYFRANPGLCGQFPIEGDPLGRTVAYGLVRGNGRRTVILTGHYDVVDTENTGSSGNTPTMWRPGKMPQVRSWRAFWRCSPRKRGQIFVPENGCLAVA